MDIPRKLIQFYEDGPFVEVIEGHAADYLEAEIDRLKALIDKMYECRFEPDKLDIYRRQAK